MLDYEIVNEDGTVLSSVQISSATTLSVLFAINANISIPIDSDLRVSENPLNANSYDVRFGQTYLIVRPAE
jgi:hypothetical protein